MMSPLTVAKNIRKGSIEFDTVIFDEASQIEPETALSSLIRADQAIIVGDTKQLPPTKFFDAEVEDDDDVREDLESILDETSSALPKEKLLWHYRSKDNELIEFSNQLYYGNRLKTFPGNDSNLDTGVEFEFVENGVYDRGGSSKNRKEAERVADLVEKHVEETPEKSLGVVAFSSKQREAIREELHNKKDRNKELRRFTSGEGLEQFFVKSLENVQGDERKKMIFSIGYGPDQNGKIHKFFGPLSKKGGERRLNVAVTRAEEKVIVVSSMQPEQLDVSNTSNKGPKHFKKYLKYAKHGDEVLNRDIKTSEQKDFDSEFEEAVYNRLTDEGLDVTTQVESSGYSIDLAVKHPEKPGKYILGIECDGAAYHSTKTARERDRLRQSVLEDLGWNIHRIWSTDWIRDEEKEIEKILDEVQELKEDGKDTE
jgi:superfamily I DNA and/or RNA helicase